MEIDFWDVGQGDCTVLKLQDGKLILIDVGPKGSPVIDWLNERRSAPQISAVVLTHNHADHVGALCTIVAAHKARIGKVYMLDDRSHGDLKELAAFRCAEQAEREGYFQLERLQKGQIIWRDDTTNTQLRVVFPGFSENVLAGNPNRTSGLIVLECNGETLIAWPGDLEIQQIGNKLAASKPIVLHGPHHGGPSDYKERPGATDAISSLAPRRSFISVGTVNPYHHPRPRYVRLLARTGCHIVCSQLTFRCERERVLHRDGIFDGAGALGLRPARRGVTCRGAWRVTVRDGKLLSDGFDEVHLERISKLKRPQCLLGRGWRRGQEVPPPVKIDSRGTEDGIQAVNLPRVD